MGFSFSGVSLKSYTLLPINQFLKIPAKDWDKILEFCIRLKRKFIPVFIVFLDFESKLCYFLDHIIPLICLNS